MMTGPRSAASEVGWAQEDLEDRILERGDLPAFFRGAVRRTVRFFGGGNNRGRLPGDEGPQQQRPTPSGSSTKISWAGPSTNPTLGRAPARTTCRSHRRGFDTKNPKWSNSVPRRKGS